MTPQEYTDRALVHKTDTFELVKPDVVHGIIGVCGEAGELADLLKKLHFHPHKQVDRDMVVDECGDILWYLALTLRACGSSFEDAMARNVAKLDTRYLKNNGEKNREAEKEAQNNVADGGQVQS